MCSFDEEWRDDNASNSKVYSDSCSEYSGNYDMILILRHYIFVVTNIDALVAIQWLTLDSIQWIHWTDSTVILFGLDDSIDVRHMHTQWHIWINDDIKSIMQCIQWTVTWVLEYRQWCTNEDDDAIMHNLWWWWWQPSERSPVLISDATTSRD